MATGSWEPLDPAIAAWMRKSGATTGRLGGASSSVPLAPTAAPPPPSRVTIAGVTPDYEKLILGDPDYQAFQANSAKTDADYGAARTAALRKLAIQYGGVGAGFQDQYGDINQETLDLAGKNQFSDTASLQRNYEQGVEAFKRQLAARNALDSGDLGYGLEQADFGRGQQQFDLANQFGSAAGTVVNNFTSAVDAQRAAQINALQQARSNQYANPLNRPTDAQDGFLDSALSAQYGTSIYRAGDGSLWTLGPDGVPISWTGGMGGAGAPPTPSAQSARDLGYTVQPNGYVPTPGYPTEPVNTNPTFGNGRSLETGLQTPEEIARQRAIAAMQGGGTSSRVT